MFRSSFLSICYTFVKNYTDYETREIKKPRYTRVFKSKAVSPKIELGSSVFFVSVPHLIQSPALLIQ